MPRVDRKKEQPALVKVPTKSTLRKYGLTREDWLAMYADQQGGCPICGLPLAGRTVVTDHEHVRKWKKMPPSDRRRYVRGILHSFCNSHVVGRFVTLAKMRAALAYLEAYHARLSNGVDSVH